jgi:hypothetical protein
MQHPFQCLALRKQKDEATHLIAACGSKIFVLNVHDGTILSSWPFEENTNVTTPSHIRSPNC